jgi:Coenzyme PQQ synthesis protein D (PqqD)
MPKCLRVRPDALEWREIDGEIVALDLRRSLYLAINPSGAVLWPALVSGASREELIELLSKEPGVPQETVAADVDSFLAELAEHDLLMD